MSNKVCIDFQKSVVVNDKISEITQSRKTRPKEGRQRRPKECNHTE